MRPFLDITKAPWGILTHFPNFMAFASLECLTRLRHDLPALSSDAAKASDADAGDVYRLDQCSRSARRHFFLQHAPYATWATASWPFCCLSISSH
ncbi:hypothetical protein BQ8794_490007 [Mesorhizobium prunaredense]|uniref:Uncharacterized protein n=1 Tax=Mesorhizobium prunaredense TaxID=1631249 RepID=A0A1R3VHJ2_9HYPH|nr:hypothetical protein BQ8794_490007 [Mesorhizobium prunaredense]